MKICEADWNKIQDKINKIYDTGVSANLNKLVNKIIDNTDNNFSFKSCKKEDDFCLYKNGKRIIKFIVKRSGFYKLVLKDSYVTPKSPESIIKEIRYKLYDHITNLSDEEIIAFVLYVKKINI